MSQIPTKDCGPGTRLTLESALLGMIVGALVVAPWLGGYVTLLDWVTGPSQGVPDALFGLNPAAVDSLLFRGFSSALRAALGPGVTGWLLILLIFPLLAGGISALAGGSRWRRHPAALLAVCNPFVIDRLYAGHVPVLLGMAFVPWLTASAIAARRDSAPPLAAGAFYALAVLCSPHALWIGGACLVAVALLPRPGLRHVVSLGLSLICGALPYLYLIAVKTTGISVVGAGEGALDAFNTKELPGGIVATILTLRGFWREAPVGIDLPAVAAIAVAVAAVGMLVAGLTLLSRRDFGRAAPLAALAVGGALLGAGVAGPLGGAYRELAAHMPLFSVMREQGKWLVLLLIAYSVAFGACVEWVVSTLHSRSRRRSHAGSATRTGLGMAAAPGLVFAGLPLVMAPSLFWGFGGAVHATTYPSGWQAAESAMGPGDGDVLFLPWHGYQPFAFTGGRSIATPGHAFFSRSVLQSDSIELGGTWSNSVSARQAFVDRVLAAGPGGDAAVRLAEAGVQYVALAASGEDYSWLGREPGLEQVLSNADMTLWRVVPTIVGRSTSGSAEPSTLGVEPAGPGLRRISPTEWEVAPGPAGPVAIPEDFAPGWVAGTRGATATAGGLAALDIGPEATRITFAPWSALRVGLVLSASATVALCAAAAVSSTRRRRGRGGTPARSAQRREPS